jgi:hypothetical protein
MNRNRTLLSLVALVLIAIGAWIFLRRGRENVAFDLVKDFPAAKKSSVPVPDSFSIIEASINGQKRQAIFMKEQVGTRITYEKAIPDNAWLEVGMGILEDAWKTEGDGVLFRIGVSIGSTYDPLVSVQLNPYSNPSDRQWNEVSLDLSQYAGQTVNIILLTNSSSPGADNRNGDWAVWGAPRIVIK